MRNPLVPLALLTVLTMTASRATCQEKPQVQVNMINACQPSNEDKTLLTAGLAMIPKSPKFGADFEVDRGRSTIGEDQNFLQAGSGAKLSGKTSTAAWVRIRKEFSAPATLSTVQYSFSTGPESTMVETLVFRVKDPKDVLEITLEDSASSVTSPATMLAANTPASRIKIERFGRSSVVLSRCQTTRAGDPIDQSAYEPLFQAASESLKNYRDLMGARPTITQELAKIPSVTHSKSAPAKAAGKPQ